MKDKLPDWFIRARQRIRAQAPKLEVMDTPEKAAAEGVPIGTAVLRYWVPSVNCDAQNAMDDMRARELMRAFPELR